MQPFWTQTYPDGQMPPGERGTQPPSTHTVVGPPQSFVMVHMAADFRPLMGGRPGVLYFVLDPASGGTFISHGIDREWVYMHAWDPDTVPIESNDTLEGRAGNRRITFLIVERR